MRCPRCDEEELPEPIESNAISHLDAKTWICKMCGRMESIIDFWKAKNMPERIPDKELAIEKIFKERLGLG